MDTTNNNMINVTVNCDAFIVPNRAAKADLDYTMGQNLATKAAEIAAENGFSYDESVDKFVQMWWTDGKSDNMQDHGFSIEIGNEEYLFGYERGISYVPINFFKDHKEGEILPLTISLKPVAKVNKDIGRREGYTSFEEDTNPAPTFQITFNLKLNQLDYRYRRFGRFEDVLKYVA